LLIVAGSQNNTCCVDILCEGQLHITWYLPQHLIFQAKCAFRVTNIVNIAHYVNKCNVVVIV